MISSSLNPDQEPRMKIFGREQGSKQHLLSASTGELRLSSALTLVPDPSPSRLWRFPVVLSRQLPSWNVTCGAGRAQVTVVLQQNTQCWLSEAQSVKLPGKTLRSSSSWRC